MPPPQEESGPVRRRTNRAAQARGSGASADTSLGVEASPAALGSEQEAEDIHNAQENKALLMVQALDHRTPSVNGHQELTHFGHQKLTHPWGP